MIDDLLALLRGKRVVVLTGAGCSTESGIPDYRGPDTPPRARPPMQHREFVDHAGARRRYWARSVLGWPRLAAATPNAGHRALAALEERGIVHGLITQNVDGLHSRAGSRNVVELHGALARVRCLACGTVTSRDDLQARLLARNPHWPERARTIAIAPDGDADLSEEIVDGFEVVACNAVAPDSSRARERSMLRRTCDGVLMPDVVFFGGSVPRPTLDAAWEAFDLADVLLVVGSSLAVFSGFRFVRRAAERGVPVAIINRGSTRGDDLARIRVDAPAGQTLGVLATAL